MIRVVGRTHNRACEGDPFIVTTTPEGARIIALCDGSGDWGDGIVGSRIAARTMAEIMARSRGEPAQRLSDAMELGGAKMDLHYPLNKWDIRPACSAAMVYIDDAGALVAWMGGIPIFLLRDGRVHAAVRPHTLMADMISSGKVSPEEAKNNPHRHVIVRALNVTGKPEVTGPWPLVEGDRLVLCYQRVLHAVTVATVLPPMGDGPESAVTRLLDGAEEKRFELAVVVAQID
jgi:serine/threonine protein phosphatase PrpC